MTDDGPTATFPGLADGEEYAFRMCVESSWDDRSFGRAGDLGERAGAPVGTGAAGMDVRRRRHAEREWTACRLDHRGGAPPPPRRSPTTTTPEFSGWKRLDVGGRPESPGIQVRCIHDWWGTATGWSTVTARAGSAPYQVQATWEVTSCVGGGTLGTRGQSSNAPDGSSAAFTFGNAGLRYFDEQGALLPHTADTWDVPIKAARVEGITVAVNWDAQGWGLAP